MGDAAVGKTCLAKRLCLDTFDSNTQLTIGIDFYTYDLPIINIRGEKRGVRLSIWDFGGQEQFKKLFPYYINGANGIFMVFDLSNPNLQSLIKLDFWYDHLKSRNIIDIPRIVLGAKYDLVNYEDSSQFKKNDLIIEQFLKTHQEEFYFKTSSKENLNVLLVFKELTRQILDRNQLDYKELI